MRRKQTLSEVLRLFLAAFFIGQGCSRLDGVDRFEGSELAPSLPGRGTARKSKDRRIRLRIAKLVFQLAGLSGRLRFCDEFASKLLGALQQVPFDYPVDDSELECIAGPDRIALGAHFYRGRYPGQAWQPLSPLGAGNDPELDLRLSDLG